MPKEEVCKQIYIKKNHLICLIFTQFSIALEGKIRIKTKVPIGGLRDITTIVVRFLLRLTLLCNVKQNIVI